MEDLAFWKQAIDSARSAIDLAKSVFGLFKDAKGALSAPDQQAVIKSLEQAEKAMTQAGRQLQLAEAQAAKALGYKICQCTFPPQIMLSIGYHKRGEERFECPRCKRKEPSDEHFRRLDSFNRPLGGGDWMS